MPKDTTKKSSQPIKATVSSNETAVVALGGKQYVVRIGQIIKTELVAAATVKVKDLLSTKTVTLQKIGDIAGPKISILKFKNKTRSQRRMGHRQKLNHLKVESIA
jgi:large subunit ribosomal protein L21